MEIDGQEQKETLFSLIMGTQSHSNQNNVIKFCDNSRWSPAGVSVARLRSAPRRLTILNVCVLAVSKEPRWSASTPQIHPRPAPTRPGAR